MPIFSRENGQKLEVCHFMIRIWPPTVFRISEQVYPAHVNKLFKAKLKYHGIITRTSIIAGCFSPEKEQCSLKVLQICSVAAVVSCGSTLSRGGNLFCFYRRVVTLLRRASATPPSPPSDFLLSISVFPLSYANIVVLVKVYNTEHAFKSYTSFIHIFLHITGTRTIRKTGSDDTPKSKTWR